jgi:hypothetical protein
MSSTSTRPFVEACLAGEALDRDIDDWIDRWHDTGGAPSGESITLAEYLGMSPREYDLWVEEPAILRTLISAHMQKMDVDDLLASRHHYALAARSDADQQSVLALVRWLVERGELPEASVAEFSN